MRILLATDGSEPAGLAVACVASLPWSEDSVVRLMAVDDAYGEERAALEASLVESTRRLRAAGLRVDPVLQAGRAASLLLAEASRFGAELIVVGSRGRGRVSALLLGSVSTEVLECARASVLVVRRPTAATVLVAVDGSPPSREVAPFLCAAGAFRDARTTVVSVSRDAAPWPPSLDLAAARAATRAVTSLGRCGIDAEREVLVGEPVPSILEAAAARSADVIAVGSRGQSRLRGLLLGSVARNVAASAAVNVLVVRRAPRTGGR